MPNLADEKFKEMIDKLRKFNIYNPNSSFLDSSFLHNYDGNKSYVLTSDLTSEQITKLSRTIETLDSDELNIDYTYLSGTLIDVLVNAVVNNSKITKLSFEHYLDSGKNNCEFLKLFITKLAQKKTNLTSLDLHYYNIDEVGGQALQNLLQNNPQLAKLKFHSFMMGDDRGAEKLSDALKNHTGIKKLLFTNNYSGCVMKKQITEYQAELLFSALSNHSSLKTLIFGGCHIGSSKGLATLLDHNQTLTELNFYDCKLGDEGARFLAHGLENNQKLVQLYVCDCEITHELKEDRKTQQHSPGRQAVLEALQSNKESELQRIRFTAGFRNQPGVYLDLTVGQQTIYNEICKICVSNRLKALKGQQSQSSTSNILSIPASSSSSSSSSISPTFVLNSAPSSTPASSTVVSPQSSSSSSSLRELPEIPEGDLQIGGRLGQGGSGTVYKGQWKGASVAIKESNQNIKKEARAMAGLFHPNIIQFYGICGDNKIVMELSTLGSLYSVIHAEKSKDNVLTTSLWTVSGECKIALDIIGGLNYLHSQNIIHRDLKSLNVLLFLVGNMLLAKLTDFGLAKSVGTTTTTTVGNSKGTIPWMAPELLKEDDEENEEDREGQKKESQKPNPYASDIYAFAIVLWEILVKEDPYSKIKNLLLKLNDIISGKLRPTIPQGTPNELVEIMKDCWATEPDKRPVVADVSRRLTVFFNTLQAKESQAAQPTQPSSSSSSNLLFSMNANLLTHT